MNSRLLSPSMQAFIVFSILSLFSFCSLAQSHKGVSFQGKIQLPGGEFPTRSGVSVMARVFSPNNCILREETFSSVDIKAGFINLGIGTGTVGGDDPGLTLKEIFDNSHTISSLVCLNGDGSVNGAVTSYDPTVSSGMRKLQINLTVDSYNISVAFNMRSVAYAVESENLGGKSANDFVHRSANITQTAVENWFSSAVMGQLLAGTYSPATATNVTGTVAIVNGGTGATSASAARTNLGLGSLATLSPTGTADATTYLRGDGSWATVTGGVSSVASKTGDVTLVAADVTDFTTEVDSRVSTLVGSWKNVNNGIAGLDAGGKIPSSILNLSASDIPNLDAAKITTGTFADSMLAGISVDKVTSSSGKYFTYAPNGTACTNGEVLKKTNNGWECAADAGSGGGDAVTLQGSAVSATAPTVNKFLQWSGTAWTPWLFPTCGTNSSLQVDALGAITCGSISSLADAAISSSAAIARSKLASGTANHVLINDGTGVMSSEAQLSVSRGGTGQTSFTDGQLLIGKSDGSLAKATLTAGTNVSITNGDGAITINATAAPPGDASYAAKGLVQFLTDAATSGISVSSGVAQVNAGVTGGAGDANKIAKLNGSGVLATAMIPSIEVDKVASATGKYFTYAPNGTACANGEVLKKTSNGWECATDGGASGADAVTLQGSAVSATAPTVNKFLQWSGTAWTPWLFPTCGTNSSLQVDALGAITCGSISSLADASISSSAAIARSKLASGTANHVLINDGTGVMSSEAQLAVSRGGTGQTSFTDGQLLIGKSDGSLAKATLTAGTNVSITNGDGAITINATAPTLSAGDIPNLDAAKITTGTFAAARMPALTGDVTTSAGSVATTIANGVVTAIKLGSDVGVWATDGTHVSRSTGNVGIGTSTTNARLTISGAATSRTNIISSGATVNLALSNNHLIKSATNSVLTLQNPADGGVYTIIISDLTSRTYTFAGCTNSYFSPANGPTANRSTYTIMVVVDGANTDCYITWITDFL